MKNRILHPFLFPVFPVLTLFVNSMLPLRHLEQVVAPILLSIAFAALLYLLLKKIFGTRYFAGVLVTLFLFYFFSYSYFYNGITGTALFIFYQRITHKSAGLLLLFLTVMAGAPLLWLLYRYRYRLGPLNSFLNVVTLIAVLFPAGLILLEAVSAESAEKSIAEKQHSGAETGGSRPDIYFLMMDGYPRQDVLRELFGYDNSGFISYLRSRGFYVADSSRSNYGKTTLSMAATMNMDYLQNLPIYPPGRPRLLAHVSRAVRENEVFRILKAKGYRTVGFDATIEFNLQLENNDVYYRTPKSDNFPLSYFQHHLLYQTPLRLLFSDTHVHDRSSYDHHRKRILNAFDKIKEAPGLKGPLFVYAHLLAPHQPHLFGPNGEPVYPSYNYTIWHTINDNRNQDEYLKSYRDEITFINKKLMETIDYVLANSAQPPIIIVQSDHGSDLYLDPSSRENTHLWERMSNLNALLIPCADTSLYYPSISNVNTFRLIFSECFGAKLPLLPDSSYFSTWDNPMDYKYVPVNADRHRKGTEK